MITKHIFLKGIIIVLYVFVVIVFSLIYRQELNIFLSKEYVLMRNIKIDSFYTVSHSGNRNGDSHYINFKDSRKKNSLLLKENTLVQKQILSKIFNEDVRIIDLVKRERNKTFFPQSTVYFTYDDRFICNVNGECNFTEAYKNEVLNHLIFGVLVFIGITYCTYRVYNSRIIKSLKGEKFQFKLLDSFKD